MSERSCNKCSHVEVKGAWPSSFAFRCPYWRNGHHVPECVYKDLAPICKHYEEREEKCGHTWTPAVLPVTCARLLGHTGLHSCIDDEVKPTPTAFDKAWEEEAKKGPS